jgi:hypothetical protein
MSARFRVWMERLLDSRSPEQRRVAVVRYCPAFAAWQRENDPLLTALRRLERRAKR